MKTYIVAVSTKKIISLHRQIESYLNCSLQKAVQIGDLLLNQKEKLNHGQFGKWIESELPFTDRTARNYIRLYKNRKQLKTENVSDFKSAYKLLAARNETDSNIKIKDEYKIFLERHSTSKYRIFPEFDRELYSYAKKSISEVGVLVPIHLDEYSNIIDGYHRAKIWHELKAEGVKLEDYPRLIHGGLSERDKLRMSISCNLIRKHYTKDQWRRRAYGLGTNT